MSAMRSVVHRAPGGRFVGRGAGKIGFRSGPVLQAALIALLSAAVIWLVWIYGNGLRDPRYLDGWLLTAGMVLQVCFHVAQKTGALSPRSSKRWRKVHIFMGFFLIAVFVVHSDFSFPDTGLEWALWTGFVMIAFSGVFGIYLTWSLESKRRVDESVGYDRIPARRAELARALRDIVADSDPANAAIALPGMPYEGWIKDLYTNHLRDFFKGPRNFAAHLFGSQLPLTRLTDEIDALSQYVDQRNQDKLSSIKDMVLEKDRLDYARVYLGLTRAWLLVHTPATYATVVLVVLHVLVVYAYSSGAW